MSKLPNAPLVEVIFEVRWDVQSPSELEYFQYLHGDLFSILKQDYPLRESLMPANTPFNLAGVPVYRYRKAENDYPLFQVGLGILSINVTDAKYFWDDFYAEIVKIIDAFLQVRPKSSPLAFIPKLSYFDLFRFDPVQVDFVEFINENLNVKVEQNFFRTSAKSLDAQVMFSYPVESDSLTVSMRGGGVEGNRLNGLILHTQIEGSSAVHSLDTIKAWVTKAQTQCSSLFKEMTAGKLYESFK